MILSTWPINMPVGKITFFFIIHDAAVTTDVSTKEKRNRMKAAFLKTGGAPPAVTHIADISFPLIIDLNKIARADLHTSLAALAFFLVNRNAHDHHLSSLVKTWIVPSS